jgi:hypothetical protein
MGWKRTFVDIIEVKAGVAVVAPPDQDLANSQSIMYVDEGGDDLKWKVRYSDGSLKTFSLNVTGAGASVLETEEIFSASNGQTAFVLALASAGGVSFFSVNGILYAEGTDYTVSGSSVTWLDTDFTLEAGDEIIIKYTST